METVQEKRVSDGSTKRLVKESAMTFVFRIAIFVLTFLSGLVIARTLGPVEKGAYNLAMALPRLLVRFGNFGYGSAAIYEIGRKQHPLNKIVGNIISLALCLGIGMIGLGFMLRDPLMGSFLKGVNPIIFAVAICLVPVSLLGDLLQDLLRGVRDMTNFNWARTSRFVVVLVSQTVFLVWLGFGIYGALAASVLAAGLEMLFTLLLVRRHASIVPVFNRDLIGAMTQFGLRASMMNVVMFLNYDLDIFIVNYFAVDTAAVGFYSLAAGLAETLWFFPNAVVLALFPSVAADMKKGGELTPRAARNVLFITFWCGVAMALGSQLIPLLYGDQFRPAITPLLLLLPGVVLLSQFKIISTGLYGYGKPLYASLIALGGLIFQVCMDVLLIPTYGIRGAATASTMAYSLMAIVGVICYAKVAHVSVVSLLLINREDLKSYRSLLQWPGKFLQKRAKRQRP